MHRVRGPPRRYRRRAAQERPPEAARDPLAAILTSMKRCAVALTGSPHPRKRRCASTPPACRCAALPPRDPLRRLICPGLGWLTLHARCQSFALAGRLRDDPIRRRIARSRVASTALAHRRGREWPRALHAERGQWVSPASTRRSRATIPSANFPCAACCGRRDMSQSPLATRNTPALVAHVSTAAEQVCAAEMLDEKPTSAYQRNTE